MKTPISALLAAILVLGLNQTVSADPYSHRDRYERHDRDDRRWGHRDWDRRDWGRHRGGRHEEKTNWGGVAAAAIILGAIGIAAAQADSSPPVVVAPRPVPPVYAPQPATQYWYYCASSRQYYPYVQYCPEGWQAVLP
ncbi:MAG TPA: hypothetical protein PLW86_03105 [Rhodocyclaceae bacterium]|nr:hypothetical protein [Rhodocyclaceae bacterium]